MLSKIHRDIPSELRFETNSAKPTKTNKAKGQSKDDKTIFEYVDALAKEGKSVKKKDTGNGVIVYLVCRRKEIFVKEYNERRVGNRDISDPMDKLNLSKQIRNAKVEGDRKYVEFYEVVRFRNDTWEAFERVDVLLQYDQVAQTCSWCNTNLGQDKTWRVFACRKQGKWPRETFSMPNKGTVPEEIKKPINKKRRAEKDPIRPKSSIEFQLLEDTPDFTPTTNPTEISYVHQHSVDDKPMLQVESSIPQYYFPTKVLNFGSKEDELSLRQENNPNFSDKLIFNKLQGFNITPELASDHNTNIFMNDPKPQLISNMDDIGYHPELMVHILPDEWVTFPQNDSMESCKICKQCCKHI